MKSQQRPDTSGERGMALVAVLLLLVLVTGLCTALIVSATTETMIARNYQGAAEARAAAEGGLSQAVQVTIAELQNWRTNGFASQSDAMSDMLRGLDNQFGTTATNADNGSLESFGIPRPPARLALGTGSFQARVFDEDDADRGLNLSAADRTRISEDGLPFHDGNTVIVVRAIGYGSGSTEAIVEAVVSKLLAPSIVTAQSLTISGSPSISGTQGSVHSNTDLIVTGSPDISQNATASGSFSAPGSPTIGGISGGNFGMITVPQVHAIDYRPVSNYILTADGKITEAGTIRCDARANQNACRSGFAWTFQSSSGWSLGGNTPPPRGTYYVESDVAISGSPGSSSVPAQLSIVATGNIHISGSPYFIPHDPSVLFVTDRDLHIGGNFTVPNTLEGLMLVREQVSITGNPTLSGQLLVEGAADVSDMVTANVISGNATLIYNGIVGFAGFTVSAWRQIQ